ncbi:MAG: hypothetical protein K0S85_3 [Pseudomonas orientalis]|nr:hypothetical protein [Pseudomonas orientalis]
MASMVKIEIKRGAGDDPGKLADAICAGQSFPFMATIAHQAVKPLLVPSTGLSAVIQPGEKVEFKVKNFEQAWVLVTDSAALAARYNSDKDDFVTIEVAAPKKTTSKGAEKAADAETA